MTTLEQVASASGARLSGGDPSAVMAGVATLNHADSQHISFLANPRYRRFLATTRAGAVILAAEDAAACSVPALIATNPLLAYARVAALFAPVEPRPRGIHPSAWVDPGAQVAASAWIGPQSTVEAGAVIGEGVFVGPHCVVGRDVTVGDDTRLVASVALCHGVRVGRRVILHPGAVIGGDGFGLANDGGRWVKIPQLGGVVLGDDVEIGANTTVDRGALDDTIIEEGVKLDNQIQIGHNCHIGAHSAMAGCVGVSGSARIGRHCLIGGGAGIGGHLDIADHVHITGMSMVPKSIPAAGVYSSGLEVETNRRWNKISARVRQLDELARRLFALEKKVSAPDPTE